MGRFKIKRLSSGAAGHAPPQRKMFSSEEKYLAFPLTTAKNYQRDVPGYL
jgi:hypothetical protein